MAIRKVRGIERHDGPILLPKEMTIPSAVDALQAHHASLQKKVQIHESISAFPWDGAIALQRVLEEDFGLATGMDAPTGPWGSMEPPQTLTVEVGIGEVRHVPWGRFSLPGIPGWVHTAVRRLETGELVFDLVAETTKEHEHVVKRIAERIRAICAKESVFRGKAVSFRFRDADGDPFEIPQPKMIPLSDQPVIFSRDLEQDIHANILTPIRHTAAARKAGIPLKRGCLLAGPYGTGKTLTAAWVAREATLQGWTFIYVPEVAELADALVLAERFQPCVVFAEDIERIAGQKRTDDVNSLLNTLDGIGNKRAEVMTILTSNHPENINPAMRRPGRIDLVLQVNPPDAEACERLVLHYGKGILSTEVNFDLGAIGEALAGFNPAVVREAVERAKLEAIRRTQGESCLVTTDDLLATAATMRRERDLFMRRDQPTPHNRLLAEGLAGFADALISAEGSNGKH